MARTHTKAPWGHHNKSTFIYTIRDRTKNTKNVLYRCAGDKSHTLNDCVFECDLYIDWMRECFVHINYPFLLKIYLLLYRKQPYYTVFFPNVEHITGKYNNQQSARIKSYKKNIEKKYKNKRLRFAHGCHNNYYRMEKWEQTNKI